MPAVVWILIWVAVMGVVAFFCVREIRAKRRGPGDFDRLRHDATAQADLRSHTEGANGFGQTWVG